MMLAGSKTPREIRYCVKFEIVKYIGSKGLPRPDAGPNQLTRRLPAIELVPLAAEADKAQGNADDASALRRLRRGSEATTGSAESAESRLTPAARNRTARNGLWRRAEAVTHLSTANRAKTRAG
jgi:hypothetical protein